MTYDEYMAKREELLNKAQTALDSNDLEEAKKCKVSVEELDAKYNELAAIAAEILENKANQQALENKIEVPEIAKKESDLEERNMGETIYNAASVEYKNAWLKEMAKDAKGRYLVGEPTAEETNAFVFTTGNTPAVVPTEIQNRIIELIDSQAPMYADANKTGMTSGFGVPRHKAINAGDAAATEEGVANNDEEDEFDLLALDGVEIKKHVDISRKMSFQSIEAFENWIVDHLAKRIAVAKENRIIAQLNTTAYGIGSENVLTSQSYTEATMRAILAKIKGTGQKIFYASSATIWNSLFGIQDANLRPIFVPDSTSDPLVQGRIYGALVKQNDNIPDDVIYAGISKQILANDFDALTTGRDVNIKTWVTTISGYSLFDAGLENPLSFVKASF